jgi:group I intron endonuclease
VTSYVVYKLTNTVNGKQYVGITKYDVDERFKGHVKAASRGVNTYLARAIRKYGTDCWDKEVIVSGVPDYMVQAFEMYWIRELDTFNTGYNLTLGGEGTKGKARPKGKYSAWYGRRHTEETKQLIREKALGRKLSQKTKMALAEARRKRHAKGWSHTEETKKKMSELKIGKPGHKHTEEHKRRIADWSSDKTVYTFVHMDGREVTTTQRILKKKYGATNDICRVIKGTRKSNKGWKLK